MIADDRFDRDMQAWLEAEAPATAPSGLHDAVIDRARRSRQRPGWLVALRGRAIDGPFHPLDRPSLRVGYLLVMLALVVAFAVAAIVVGALRSDPLKLGRNGAIAYSVLDNSQRNQPHHARLMNADGTGDRAIYPASCPTFSRDGSILVYTTGSHSTAELNVAGPDGASPRVMAGIGDSDYALSPDGTHIAWFKRLRPITSSDGNTTVGFKDELWVIPVSGGPAVRIVPASDRSDEWYSVPLWSPDGRHIAFASSTSIFDADDGGSYRSGIHVVDDDGSNLRQLTSRPGTDQIGIAWSPDGRSVAYVGLPDGSPLPSFGAGSVPSDGSQPPVEIFVINADGTDDRDLTNTKSDDFGPEWSPDGIHLAYETFQDGLPHLATIRMDGSAAVGAPILGPASDGFTWSPNGTELLSLNELVTDPSAGTQDVPSTILSVDAEFRRSPTTLLRADSIIDCVPSWQRLEP